MKVGERYLTTAGRNCFGMKHTAIQTEYMERGSREAVDSQSGAVTSLPAVLASAMKSTKGSF